MTKLGTLRDFCKLFQNIDKTYFSKSSKSADDSTNLQFFLSICTSLKGVPIEKTCKYSKIEQHGEKMEFPFSYTYRGKF